MKKPSILIRSFFLFQCTSKLHAICIGCTWSIPPRRFFRQSARGVRRSFERAVRRPNVQMEACSALLPPSGSERVPHASSRVISFRSPHYTIPKSALEPRSSHVRSSLCRRRHRHRLLHSPSVPFRSLFSVRPSSMNVPFLPSEAFKFKCWQRQGRPEGRRKASWREFELREASNQSWERKRVAKVEPRLNNSSVSISLPIAPANIAFMVKARPAA